MPCSSAAVIHRKTNRRRLRSRFDAGRRKSGLCYMSRSWRVQASFLVPTSTLTSDKINLNFGPFLI